MLLTTNDAIDELIDNELDDQGNTTTTDGQSMHSFVVVAHSSINTTQCQSTEYCAHSIIELID